MSDSGKQSVAGARAFLPERLSLLSLREAARHCQGCDLYRNASQTVFGEGKRAAPILLIGEQPGNEEDLRGKPFVGPAGRLLDEALESAGIDRGDTYITNVVKHFKWVPKGKRRIHKTPGGREIAACLPWLEKEIEVIRPKVLVCLGAVAAKAVLGREFRVSIQRGRVLPSKFSVPAVATVHPSSILRLPAGSDRHKAVEQFVSDLQVAAGFLNQP